MYNVAIITLSDLGAAGKRVDESGPLIKSMLDTNIYQVTHEIILPDDFEQIKTCLHDCCDTATAVDLVLTTGGTGFSKRDVTPEATTAVCDRMTPGIAEAMRSESLKYTPRAMLSRATAGIRKNTLIINLPGSPKAARENLEAILPALDHGLAMLKSKGSANCAEN